MQIFNTAKWVVLAGVEERTREQSSTPERVNSPQPLLAGAGSLVPYAATKESMYSFARTDTSEATCDMFFTDNTPRGLPDETIRFRMSAQRQRSDIKWRPEHSAPGKPKEITQNAKCSNA
ncbi:MAG: hypothetical protein KC877_03050 [Candidatus Kaiserbacteria bacterium]|nr:hypothetical protein [Candidatus Kaiserbacteria bacterium]MCB9815760.1 hypothetical protein [Candidatus Nomurabacteria bacterium]